MASQITHVVFGKKIFDRIENQKIEWSKFVVATLLPDIRELAGLDRDTVHIYPTSEDEIPINDSFNSGFYVHSFVDDKRTKILEELGAYDIFPYEYPYDTALKLREDQLFYEDFDNWDEIIEYLNEIYQKQIEITDNREVVEKWHKFLQKYFSKKPDWEVWEKLLKQGNFKQETIIEITEKLEVIQNDQKFDKLLLQLKERI